MPAINDDVLKLKAAIEKHCLSIHETPVLLNSGGYSNYYLDLKGVALHPVYARIIGQLMAPAVIASGAEAVGGLAAGCIQIADAIAQAALDVDVVLPTFFGRPEAKDHGPSDKSRLRQAAAEDDGPLVRPGRKVAIVEDAVTQGGAAMQATEFALGEGCDVVLVMCVVERHEGGGARFRDRGLTFKRLFYTHEDGSLHVDAEVTALAGNASR
jgi:orotate phosphoribosyltransferase